MPIVMGVFGGIAALGFLSQPTSEPGMVPFLAVWFGFLGFFAYQMFRMPTSIEWHGDGSISFRGPLRTLRIAVSEIESIRPGGNNLGFFELRHSGKKLRFLNQFNGFHEFLGRLKQENPGVELLGC